jgi:hypothetical protein
MDLETYLEAHEITLHQVYQTLEDTVGVTRDEMVFLSGSLLSGFGNFHSDIDAFIVTSRELPQPTVGDIFILPIKDTQIDLERWPPAAVDSLFRRVEAATQHAGARDPRPAMMFTRRELEFLYRLRIGRPLSAEAQFDALVARLKPELVARVLFDCSRVVSASLQTDIAGCLQEGDDGSAFLAAHQLVGVVADAFLASHGELNPGPKWRYRALLSIGTRPEELGLPVHFGGPRMVDVFLQFWTGSQLKNGLADYARQAVMLLTLVMPWCQRRLDTYDVMDEPNRDRVVPMSHGPLEVGISNLTDTVPAEDLPLGQLKTEARVSWSAKGMQLHLPGEDAYAIGIGPVTHMALAYFDGQTTARQAAHSLAASCGSPIELLLRALLDLRIVLLSCGYLDPNEPCGRQMPIEPYGR